MTTEITNISSNLGPQTTKLNQLTVKKVNDDQIKSDNVIRIDFNERQNIAESVEVKSKEVDELKTKDQSVDQSVDELNTSNQLISRNLEFHIDNDSGRTVIVVRDTATKEVIRQIPSEQLLEISERLKNIQNNATEEQNNTNTGILFSGKT